MIIYCQYINHILAISWSYINNIYRSMFCFYLLYVLKNNIEVIFHKNKNNKKKQILIENWINSSLLRHFRDRARSTNSIPPPWVSGWYVDNSVKSMLVQIDRKQSWQDSDMSAFETRVINVFRIARTRGTAREASGFTDPRISKQQMPLSNPLPSREGICLHKRHASSHVLQRALILTNVITPTHTVAL